jgi:uncharacterized protein with GYD domain
LIKRNRRYDVAKYLFQDSLAGESLKGLLKEGKTRRREEAIQFVESLGGTVESYYFAFGDTDAYIIVDLPDNVIATAGSLIGNTIGTTKTKATVLIMPEEVDQAAELAKRYQEYHRRIGGRPPERWYRGVYGEENLWHSS